MPNSNIIKSKKVRGKHSSPSTSGKQNLPSNFIEKKKGSGGGKVKDIIGIYNRGTKNMETYKGLWEDDILLAEITDYFEYCAEYDVKPAKVGLQLWLGISKSQYWEWENNPIKYGAKSNLIEQANCFMEIQYIGNIEKFPTGNIFLLKSSHKHQDKQDIQITSGNDVSKDEISDVVSKLGLDTSK